MTLRMDEIPIPNFTTPPQPAAYIDGDVVGWQQLLFDDFTDGIDAPCQVHDYSADGFDRYWDTLYNFDRDSNAAWPAYGGADNVIPYGNNYPPNMYTWISCGLFDLTEADDFLIRFDNWRELNDHPDDFLFVGAAVLGQDPIGLRFTGSTTTSDGWQTQEIFFDGITGSAQVWVGFLFASDVDSNTAAGAWLDNIEVLSYVEPTETCGNVDPGDKGVVLPPFDPTTAATLPIIRPDDIIALDKIAATGTDWVRLGFIQTNGAVNLQQYDFMVDNLCNRGISVVGLVNDETLVRQDFNNLGTAADYRQEFAAEVQFIVEHFEGRISHWEVWNEPDLGEETGNPPWIDPEFYAPLLNDTYQTILQGNSNAKVLFGGLASAWSDTYLADVYFELNTVLGAARPFDYFAIHPYTDGRIATGGHGVNPQVYMYDDNPDYDTILDKFTETMSSFGDSNKTMWVTEIGWNSSLDSPTAGWCLANQLVYETDQAAFLKPAFDILFNEVDLWGTSTSAVDKVIWYQYMDVGIPDVCPPQGQNRADNMINEPVYAPFSEMTSTSNSGVIDWWFGLYRGDKVTPKEAWCEFLAYPLTCDQFFQYDVYLPITVKSP